MSDLNTNKTVYKAPSSGEGENRYTAGTVYKGSSVTVDKKSEESAPTVNGKGELLPEGTTVDGYKINGVISESGCESVVYLVMKNGMQYALKLYGRPFEFTETKLHMLKRLESPYVAHLEDYGYYDSKPYEVYPYYKNGTVENLGRVEGVKLKEYINQLNEGLRCLHNIDAGSEMIHGDLKPSNIFISDDREHILIGDFGISNIKKSDESLFGEICGTPEFAPPTAAVVGTMSKTKAYDYGSLGLVVLFLATGYSYFSGYSAESISAEWKKGISVPADLESSVKRLLEGLLVFDENERFGYEDVRSWYEGAFIHFSEPKNLYAKQEREKEATLWMGIVDGQVVEVSSIQEWVKCMKNHWNLAVVRLGDNNMYRFIDSFYPDGEKTREIRSYADSSDRDAAVFKIIYSLSDIADFVYKGKKYKDINAFIKAVCEGDGTATEAVEKGLLMFYIIKMGYPESVICAIEDIMNLKNCPEEIKTKIISYSFSGKKEFGGWDSVEKLRDAVCEMELEEIEELTKNTEFLAWLYVMGLKETALSIIRNGE